MISKIIKYPKKQIQRDEQGNELPEGAKIVKDKNGKVIRVMVPAKNDNWY